MSGLHLVITGANRGIGLELTRQSLEAGNRVSATARDPQSAKELQGLAQKHQSQLKVFACDVTDDTQVIRLKLDLKAQGAIDVLINNAGMYAQEENDFSALDLKKVEQTLETNTLAPMRITQALFTLLEKSKKPKLACISSLMGSIADNTSGGSYGYRMSKTALNMFLKTFAVNHPQIVTLALHPGWVQTRMGGSSAPTTSEESARGLLKVIHSAEVAQSGRFFDFEGDEIPW